MRWVVLAVVAVLGCRHRDSDPPGFRVIHAMVPMRDGVHLDTFVFVPDGGGPYGMLYERSPYNWINWDTESKAPRFIEILQNVRGRIRSEGTFEMVRPPRDRRDPKSVDEATDAYDTIEWALANVPNHNGRVCMYGVSYDAWTATMTLLDPHPAEKCIIAGASIGDMFLGDDFHHHGAFRLSYGLEYAVMEEGSSQKDSHFEFDLADTYDSYLRLGALSHANERYLHGTLPTWENFIAHPDRDAFWRRRSVIENVHTPTVPIMNVAGFWDQEDPWGPIAIYRELAAHDPERRAHLVAGPWFHGGWYAKPWTTFGPFDFDPDPSERYADLQTAWLNHWFYDTPLVQSQATIFETGGNRWRELPSWPPPNAKPRRLYLRADRSLAFEAPRGNEAADTYVSDPANPVPYRKRPITPTYPKPDWQSWLVQDQRFVDHRPDVLTYQTPVLDRDIVIGGAITAELWASTSGTDSDWIVKLIDVFPDGVEPKVPDPQPPDRRGYQVMIAADILRGRYRDSWEHPSAIPADAPVRYSIDLHTQSHVFRSGHRIMVQIQSTWFPLYDRNPQVFVPNIYRAKDSDYRAATQRVFHTPAMPSAIVLPIE